ncbi:MAG: DUF11 domain-containing protein, partial [Salana multivorans]|nr:DUF11 domain-containing protein [Salana multivorans]
MTGRRERSWSALGLGLLLLLGSLGLVLPPAYAAATADLEISQTASPSPVGQGELLTWTIVVANHGPDDATGVEVNDNFNEYGTDSAELVSVTPSQGTCEILERTFNCSLGTVRSGSSATMTLTVIVLDTISIANVADVTSGTEDQNWDNNHVATSTPAGPAADLELDKTVEPATAAPGDSVTYTLELHNAGPSTATGVTLVDPLPAGLEDVGVEPSGSCSVASGEVSCSPGSLVSGGTFTATVTATVAASFAGTEIVNTASATATTIDPDLESNTATATVAIEAAAADLAVTKTLVTDPPVAGEPVRYTIAVTNEGPADAEGVELTDEFPAVLTDAVASPDLGTCEVTAGDLACDLGDLPVGVTATVTLDATLAASATGVLANTATVTSATPDPEEANDSSTATGTIATAADLAITKTASTSQATNGDEVTYTLRVRAHGPSTATDAVVTDELPADLSYVAGSCTTDRGTCSLADGVLAFDLGDLEPDAEVTLTYRVIVGEEATGEAIVNTAAVAATTPDPVAANDEASYTLNVEAAADLVLTKTVDAPQLVAGGPVTFVLTTRNDGPGTSTDLDLTDAVPAAVRVTGVTASDGACDSGTSNDVHCTLGS